MNLEVRRLRSAFLGLLGHIACLATVVVLAWVFYPRRWMEQTADGACESRGMRRGTPIVDRTFTCIGEDGRRARFSFGGW